MARKKSFKGNAIQQFSIKGKSYELGQTFSTRFEETYKYLINTKRIQ